VCRLEIDLCGRLRRRGNSGRHRPTEGLRPKVDAFSQQGQAITEIRTQTGQFGPLLNKGNCTPINPTVGDLDSNVTAILMNVEAARTQGADTIVFTKLAITGYPPEDLLLKPQFVEANLATLERVAAAQDILIVSFADRLCQGIWAEMPLLGT